MLLNVLWYWDNIVDMYLDNIMGTLVERFYLEGHMVISADLHDLWSTTILFCKVKRQYISAVL